MAIYRKEIDETGKYLSILGFRIPYSTKFEGERREANIGGIKIEYWFDEEENAKYFKVGNKRLYFQKSRKAKHYRLKDTLTDKRCQQILEKELTPLLGYKPNLNKPKSFNEKINWMKLHYKNPLVTICCDKYAVKEYAKKRIDEKYILPVLGVWERAENVDFSALPERFALKVNWSSGYNIIVKDKSQLDIADARKKLNRWMQPSSNSYYDMFNWGYKDMKPVIYAEPYIEQIDGQVYDYKFFFSNGEFIYMFISTDRLDEEKTLTYTFYDKDFKHLPFTYGNKPNANPIPEMPKNLDKMLELAKKLAEPFPFVRVDFYELDENTLYLGEMTFYTGGGTLPFKPKSWDWVLGEKIIIPEDNS